MDSNQVASLKTILSADLSELAHRSTGPTLEAIYGRVLMSYLIASDTELIQATEELQQLALARSCTMASALAEIAMVRVAIRQRVQLPDRLLSLTHSLASLPPELAGEAHFVLGVGYEVIGNDTFAAKHFLAAEQHLSEVGLKKKAIRARHNLVAARARLDPSRRMIYQFRKIAKEAMALGAYEVGATAYSNLSREFQMMGAVHLAYESACHAVRDLAEVAHGTYHYFNAVAQRAHIACELDYEFQAQRDYEEVAAAPFGEARAAADALCDAIRLRFRRAPSEIKSSAAKVIADGTWRHRKALFRTGQLSATKVAFTDLEEEVIRNLAATPQTRGELATALYGGRLSSESADNRVRQVFHRIGRKAPKLIDSRNGRYFLVNGGSGWV